MSEWDWDWEAHAQRRETGLIEHVCRHGVGHPNPGSARWVAECIVAQRIDAGEDPGEVGSVDDHEEAWRSHGCDGCCRDASFPGWREALIHAHGIIREQHRVIQDIQRDAGERLAAASDQGSAS